MTETNRDQELLNRALAGEVGGSLDIQKPKKPKESERKIPERLRDTTRDLRDPLNTPLKIWEE